MKDQQTKVVLVNPKDGAMPYGFYAVYENLGIAYLTASLRANNISTAIVDAYARNLSCETAAEEIISYIPQIVGFTCTYLSYPEAVKIAKILKERLKGVYITLGGEHATYSFEEIMVETDVFDSIIFGEGEATIVDLAQSVIEGKDLSNVKGIGYCDNEGKIKRNAYRSPITDLDSIPFPARDTLDYCVANGKQGLIGMLGSRGCKYNCSFCNAHEYFNIGCKPACRRRSPKNIVNEFEYIYKNYYNKGLYKLIYLYDATFVYSNSEWRKWVKDICNEIIQRDIHVSFEINARADSFTEKDDELLYLLKSAGLKSVFIGLESGSEDVLDKYNKKTSVKQNLRIMDILAHHGIQSTTNGFIMFNPFITLNGLRNSADFLLSVGQCTYWNLSQKVQLFPGIKMIKDLKESEILLDTYKHTEVYAYKFIHPKVEALSKVLNFSYEEIPTRENHIVRYVEIMLEQLMDMVGQVEGLKDEQVEEIHKLKSSVENARMDIFKLNRDFFVNTIDMVETLWDDDKFKKAKSSYVKDMENKIDILSKNFESFINCIDDSTAETPNCEINSLDHQKNSSS